MASRKIQAQPTAAPGETIQRWVLLIFLFAVILWVKIGSADSTIVKPELVVVFALIMAGSALIRAFYEGGARWHRSEADLPIIIFLVSGLISWAISESTVYGSQTLLLTASYVVCFFTGLQLFRRRKDVQWLLTSLFILAFIVCSFGLLQYFWEEQTGIDFQLGSSRRVVSTLGNATFLGAFLTVVLPICAGQLMFRTTWRRRVMLAVLILLIIAVLILTQARASMLASFLGALLLFFIVKAPRARRLLFIGAGIVAAGFLLILLFPSLSTPLMDMTGIEQDISLSRRTFFWDAALKAIADAPFFGHGPGSHPLVIPRFRDPGYWVNGSEDIVPHTHNEFLEHAVENGVIGLIIYTIVLGVILWKGFSASSSGRWERITGLSLACAVAAVLFENLVSVSLRQPSIAMTTWLVAGVMLSGTLHSKNLPEVNVLFRKNVVAASLSFFVFAVLLFLHARSAYGRFESDSHLFLGREAERNGQHSIAIKELKNATERDPANLVGMLELGIAQLRAKQLDESLITMRSLREKAPDYPKTHLMESLALFQLDSLMEADDAIEKELQRRDHPETYYTRSLIHAKLDDTVGVRTALELVIERNIVAHSEFFLENASKTLLSIARTGQQLDRLEELLRRALAIPSRSGIVAQTLIALQKKRNLPEEER